MQNVKVKGQAVLKEWKRMINDAQSHIDITKFITSPTTMVGNNE